jgi:hypothetical protein
MAERPGGDGVKIIYVSGPYRDPRGEWYVHEHIRTAEAASIQVWKLGAVAICPHLNTRFFGGFDGLPDTTWLDGDLEIIRRCDAMLMLEGWRRSTGAKMEKRLAADLKLPILYSLTELETWIKTGKRPKAKK